MVLYLTSNCMPHPENEKNERTEFDKRAVFFADLKNEWPENASLLYVPCNPKETEDNARMLKEILGALGLAGLMVNEAFVLDDQLQHSLHETIARSNVIYLADGHAPTQLSFVKRIGLKKELVDYKGIIIGQNAGAVNSATYVYLMPELEGEAKDPNFIKFSEGLSLTNVQMIPHSELMRKRFIDGFHFIEDIVIPDSYGRRFYLVSDGSYFKVKGGRTTFHGHGEIIEDGVISPLKQGTIVPYMGHIEQPAIKTLLADGYDMVLGVNKNTGQCKVYYLCNRLWEVFENSKMLYDDICYKLSKKVIEREQKPFLDQLRLSVILNELEDRGSFVRTIHIDTSTGRRAKNIRVRNIPGYPDWILIIYFDITTAIDHDWMTDEYARTGFMERARLFISELSENDHYSLVYTNVKGFKAVNELFGDKSGDLLIFQTRDILRKLLKPVLVGRLESDHFVLITADENLSEKNLNAVCRQVFKIESKEYNFEVRCGIYAIRNSQTEITALLAGAKLAEKNIRNGKRNILYAYYDDIMKENYVKQRFLLSDFERGIGDNEFEPYYQPIVDAQTGEIISAEMLIRWRHKDFGMVPPGDFVPIIESEGKISALDSFMVERGLYFIGKLFMEKKKAVPCAINLSRVDFYDSAFIEGIFERLQEQNIDPTMIRFEVTESAYADLESKAMDYLNKMKKQGIKILLDDYGSGMSSLSMLETFDFDIIKLDLGFIRKIGINDKAESIVISTINLAHSIGAKVTAEGVETEAQLQFLRNAGCDYIQGYYFYKPLPESKFMKLL